MDVVAGQRQMSREGVTRGEHRAGADEAVLLPGSLQDLPRQLPPPHRQRFALSEEGLGGQESPQIGSSSGIGTFLGRHCGPSNTPHSSRIPGHLFPPIPRPPIPIRAVDFMPATSIWQSGPVCHLEAADRFGVTRFKQDHRGSPSPSSGGQHASRWCGRSPQYAYGCAFVRGQALFASQSEELSERANVCVEGDREALEQLHEAERLRREKTLFPLSDDQDVGNP